MIPFSKLPVEMQEKLLSIKTATFRAEEKGACAGVTVCV